jgi:hypothetical protein
VGPDAGGQPPGAVGENGQDDAEQGQPGELHALPVGQAEEQPVDDDGDRRRGPAEQGAQDQAPEEQLLDQRRAQGQQEQDQPAGARPMNGRLSSWLRW